MKILLLSIGGWLAIVLVIIPGGTVLPAPERPSAHPWVSEGLQAWGGHRLAVDFGLRGLWSYDGSWIRLSYWNPEAMEAWGGDKLAVNFGPHGLWTYDGVVWIRLSLQP